MIATWSNFYNVAIRKGCLHFQRLKLWPGGRKSLPYICRFLSCRGDVVHTSIYTFWYQCSNTLLIKCGRQGGVEQVTNDSCFLTSYTRVPQLSELLYKALTNFPISISQKTHITKNNKLTYTPHTNPKHQKKHPHPQEKSMVHFAQICDYLLAFFLPPLGVFFKRGCSADTLINIGLTILGYIPGMAGIQMFFSQYLDISYYLRFV